VTPHNAFIFITPSFMNKYFYRVISVANLTVLTIIPIINATTYTVATVTALRQWIARISEVRTSPALRLTPILLKCRIWWAPSNTSKWQMGFNSTFKGLIQYHARKGYGGVEVALLSQPQQKMEVKIFRSLCPDRFIRGFSSLIEEIPGQEGGHSHSVPSGA